MDAYRVNVGPHARRDGHKWLRKSNTTIAQFGRHVLRCCSFALEMKGPIVCIAAPKAGLATPHNRHSRPLRGEGSFRRCVHDPRRGCKMPCQGDQRQRITTVAVDADQQVFTCLLSNMCPCGFAQKNLPAMALISPHQVIQGKRPPRIEDHQPRYAA